MTLDSDVFSGSKLRYGNLVYVDKFAYQIAVSLFYTHLIKDSLFGKVDCIAFQGC